MRVNRRKLILVAGGAWFGLTLAVASAAVWFRFARPYDLDDQFALQILTVTECAMATAGLVCSLPLLVRTAISPAGARLSLLAVVIPVFFAFALQIIALETHRANQLKNEHYLSSHAELVIRYYKAKQRMPESFDRVLEWSGTRLEWRGDADGNPVQYQKVGKTTFLICASTPRLHLRIDGKRIAASTWTLNQPDPCRENGPR